LGARDRVRAYRVAGRVWQIFGTAGPSFGCETY